jgi:metallophosphoesterase superfamily enzyme
MFHTRASQSPGVLSALAEWRRQHPAIGVTLVLGNHDLHAGPPPATLAIDCVAEPYALEPFVCYHHPPETQRLAKRSYALAGHLHPAAMLRDADGSRLRLPCFHVGERAAVLPAFGTFTGGHAVRPRAGDRVFVLAEGIIAEVTHDARNPSGTS